MKSDRVRDLSRRALLCQTAIASGLDVVDGKAFLVLGGELSNTVSSDTARMKAVWPLLAGKVHMNTILTGISWDWIEPGEGKYDFRLVDQLIENARQNNVHIVWIYFGSWKNGLSSFAPA
jgi:GH35 family endo-1,4-beta-xylanase